MAGNLAFPAYDGDQLPSLAELTLETVGEFFFCLSGTESNLRERLEETRALKIPANQILLYVDSYPATLLPPSGCTVLEYHSHETPEDLRHRLWTKIESLRQQRLHQELSAPEKFLPTLSEADRQRAQNQARIAHALAYLYDFSPVRHAQCIQLAARHGNSDLAVSLQALAPLPDHLCGPYENVVWQPAMPFETILASCAALLLVCCDNPIQFREAFRTKSSLLTFKVRNELKLSWRKSSSLCGEEKMRLSFLLLLLAATLPAQASTVSSVRCYEISKQESYCQIQLEGKVAEGERLYLSGVQESDQIFWEKTRLGATGMLFDEAFFAAFLPRLYSLQPVQGQLSPLLSMRARSIFSSGAGIPKEAKVRVVDAHYPITKVLSPLYFPVVSFLLLALAWFYLVAWLQRQTIDGWIYPREELRWFFGSLAAYLILNHSVSKLFVPLTWPVELHLFAERLSLLVCAWSHSALLLNGRFSDRSCVERGLTRRVSSWTAKLFAGLFILSIAAMAFAPRLPANYFYFLLAIQSVFLVYNSVLAVTGTEWRRILKRSGTSPLLFHFSLLIFPFALLAFSAGRFFSLLDGNRLLAIAASQVLIAGVWRLYRFQYVIRRSSILASECRELLQPIVSGEKRLATLCAFIESEWGAARVSVISVEDSQGLVLASAGPDAISAENRAEPRKLGPFLRRVCKEGHILYAPVAEELGKDLQEKGMRHSSLALPLKQEGRVRVVICIMADEGERIHPLDATLMELLTESLGLEILSAVSQHIADEKNERLMAISRNSGGLAVEHMDGWGHLHFSKSEEERYLVGAESGENPGFLRQLRRSPAMKKLLESYELELRSVWTGLAESWEFLPKDVNGDFWVLSPREFRQPFLQSLGSERAALLLAFSLERAARIVASKPGYLALGICPAKLIVGGTKLRLVSYGPTDTGNVQTDAADFSLLQRLREDAAHGDLLFLGDDPMARLNDDRFKCVAQNARPLDIERLYSVIGLHCDKKELRKLEARAMEQARLYLKRAA